MPTTNCSPANWRLRWCARTCAASPAAAAASEGRLRARILEALPYSLTPLAAAAPSDDIVTDLARPQRMLRLLQGDVGSGKTVVALLAAAAVIEAGRQAALMAPTEILARQHLATIAPLAEAAGLRIAILTGRERGRERAGDAGPARARRYRPCCSAPTRCSRKTSRSAISRSPSSTNSIASACTSGWRCAQKGEAVDMLVLTATPIPRTLVLTYFGDMDISELREKPAGRQPIDTRTIPLARLEEVEDAVGRALADGQRAYWVCPLVEESEKIDSRRRPGALRGIA